jgi:hypothetical protein
MEQTPKKTLVFSVTQEDLDAGPFADDPSSGYVRSPLYRAIFRALGLKEDPTNHQTYPQSYGVEVPGGRYFGSIRYYRFMHNLYRGRKNKPTTFRLQLERP